MLCIWFVIKVLAIPSHCFTSYRWNHNLLDLQKTSVKFCLTQG